jgi:hypothetical protein
MGRGGGVNERGTPEKRDGPQMPEFSSLEMCSQTLFRAVSAGIRVPLPACVPCSEHALPTIELCDE